MYKLHIYTVEIWLIKRLVQARFVSAGVPFQAASKQPSLKSSGGFHAKVWHTVKTEGESHKCRNNFYQLWSSHILNSGSLTVKVQPERIKVRWDGELRKGGCVRPSSAEITPLNLCKHPKKSIVQWDHILLKGVHSSSDWHDACHEQEIFVNVWLSSLSVICQHY